MRIFHNLDVDFLGKRRFFYFLSALFFLIGLVSVVFRGLIFGIDFKGGTEIGLQFQKPVDIAQVRNYVNTIGLGEVELKTFGQSSGILLRTEMQEIPRNILPRVIGGIDRTIEKNFPGLKRQIVDSSATSVTFAFANPDTTNDVVNKLLAEGYQSGKFSEEATNTKMVVRVGISEWIKENLKEKMPGNTFQVLKEDKVGPKVGNELKTSALISVFLSLVGILIYLAFRFKFIFAFGAVVALFHDVLITLGLYAALYNVIPGLNLEINLTVVAAFLTLIGYSVNDTVIVFDRVREYLKIHKSMPIEEAMNKAVNATMSRTVLTGGTTLMSVLVLLIFGGEVLRAFSFTLFFGIITGTYSSVFVASAIVLEYVNRTKRKLDF
ncbi:MAG: protein translocase subunit SecF [Ignavibacteria bacterium]|jgi:preprotein translocase subunit SecF|nr:protein translocase subunit SecF [Ignavibacteria bacterium]MCU7517724.1 protein translocase subunit SecF [Ignavibacteria bacterium]